MNEAMRSDHILDNEHIHALLSIMANNHVCNEQIILHYEMGVI